LTDIAMALPARTDRADDHIVGWAVALAAVGETLVHPFGMGGAMTIGASGDGAVLLRMATGAGDITMARRSGGQLLSGRLMAGDTMLRRESAAVIQGGRHMRLMTEAAVGFGLGRHVRGVTATAKGFGPVAAIVTGGTGECGVTAWQPLQFCALGGMTGETHRGDVSLELDFHGSMGIMAAATIGQLVMGTAGVAKIAGWDVLCLNRPVSFMAGLTGDGRLVSHALLGN
jgi:hypothetical protein